MNTKELREKRAKLVADARTELAKITDATPEGEAKAINVTFDTMMTKADELKGQIDRAEKLEATERDLGTSIGRQAGQGAGERLNGGVGDDDAPHPFFNWAANGEAWHGAKGTDDKSISQLVKASNGMAVTMKLRPKGAATDPQSTTGEGSDFIPQGFQAELEKADLAFGGMREAARVLRTATGNALPWPTMDDTANEGVALDENADGGTVNQIATGVVTFNAFKFSSKMVKVSLELMQDSAFDWNTIVGAALAERLARIKNRRATTGTGSGQPNGVVTASTAGKTAALSSAVTVNELIDLQHSVDPAYRTSPSTRYMFHDNTLRDLKKLQDTTGRPLWLPGIAVREPDRLLGYQYIINQHMATMEASAKSVLFGDFSKFVMRDVLDVTVLRLIERYAEFLQVAFIAIQRFDTDLVDAGTHPIKHLVHPSP